MSDSAGKTERLLLELIGVGVVTAVAFALTQFYSVKSLLPSHQATYKHYGLSDANIFVIAPIVIYLCFRLLFGTIFLVTKKVFGLGRIRTSANYSVVAIVLGACTYHFRELIIKLFNDYFDDLPGIVIDKSTDPFHKSVAYGKQVIMLIALWFAALFALEFVLTTFILVLRWIISLIWRPKPEPESSPVETPEE